MGANRYLHSYSFLEPLESSKNMITCEDTLRSTKSKDLNIEREFLCLLYEFVIIVLFLSTGAHVSAEHTSHSQLEETFGSFWK